MMYGVSIKNSITFLKYLVITVLQCLPYGEKCLLLHWRLFDLKKGTNCQ